MLRETVQERWREWIFPVPFAKYGDPMPGFEGPSPPLSLFLPLSLSLC
jgi:hypothetical protein